jgi:hypothetical protein
MEAFANTEGKKRNSGESRPCDPSRVFKRNDCYCFRLVLPEAAKGMAGDEIRLSLRTPIRLEALKLSRYLPSHLSSRFFCHT